MLDLAPEATEDEATKQQSIYREDNLTFRDGQRYVARLVRKQLSQILTFRSDGTYLITGGLGALGLRVARWMVEQGSRQLVLLGVVFQVRRRKPEPTRAGRSQGSSSPDVSNEGYGQG